MGSKSSSAPAPDPRLVEAQLRSMGIQDNAIQQVMSMANDMLPLQREQMQFGLDSQRTAWQQSQEDRQWALGRRSALSGLQDKLISDANSFSAEDRGNKLAGEAVGDVKQAFSAARAASGRDMARMGVNPNDGKFAAMEHGSAIGEALGSAQAANGARESARREGYALTDRATNALAGYPAMGMQASGNGAQFAANGINLVNQGAAGMNSGFATGAQMAGQMGSNASGMYGAQGNYKLGADQQAAANNPWATLLGAGTRLGAAYLMSDRRLKESIELVGKDAATGLNLYEFSYIDDPEMRRFVGVMADEVLHLMPDAVTRGPDGFYAVNYAMLGLEMKEVGYAQ